MNFNSPVWLLALVVIPVALLAYRWARRRPSRYAVRFSAVSTLMSSSITSLRGIITK